MQGYHRSMGPRLYRRFLSTFSPRLWRSPGALLRARRAVRFIRIRHRYSLRIANGEVSIDRRRRKLRDGTTPLTTREVSFGTNWSPTTFSTFFPHATNNLQDPELSLSESCTRAICGPVHTFTKKLGCKKNDWAALQFSLQLPHHRPLSKTFGELHDSQRDDTHSARHSLL